MSSPNSPVLVLERPASPLRWALWLSIILLAVVWPWLCALRIEVAAGFALLSAAIVGGAAWRSLRFPGRIARATWGSDGEWRLQLADGHDLAAQLSRDSWVTGWVLVLRWRCGIQHHGFTIMRPELTAAEWHRWQLRLRLEAARSAQDAAPA